jgi:hypothetical protein
MHKLFGEEDIDDDDDNDDDEEEQDDVDVKQLPPPSHRPVTTLPATQPSARHDSLHRKDHNSSSSTVSKHEQSKVIVDQTRKEKHAHAHNTDKVHNPQRRPLSHGTNTSSVAPTHKTLTSFAPPKSEKHSVKLTSNDRSSVSPLPPVVPSIKIKDLAATAAAAGSGAGNRKDLSSVRPESSKVGVASGSMSEDDAVSEVDGMSSSADSDVVSEHNDGRDDGEISSSKDSSCGDSDSEVVDDEDDEVDVCESVVTNKDSNQAPARTSSLILEDIKPARQDEPPLDFKSVKPEAAMVDCESLKGTVSVSDHGLDGLTAAANGESLCVLLELQEQLMMITDDEHLEQLTVLIEQSGGQFQVTDTFNFDLCSLDRQTIHKLKAFLQQIHNRQPLGLSK